MMRKNKKGAMEFGMVGIIVVVAITLIVGLLLFQVISQEVGKSTNTITLGGANSNQTILSANVPDAINTKIDLIGQDLIGSATVVNATGGQTATSGNYTVGEYVSPTTGVKSIYFELDDPQFTGANLTASGSLGLNITYTYGPEGYINNSGARGMAGLIAIMFALALAVVALSPTLRSGLMDMFGR